MDKYEKVMCAHALNQIILVVKKPFNPKASLQRRYEELIHALESTESCPECGSDAELSIVGSGYVIYQCTECECEFKQPED